MLLLITIPCMEESVNIFIRKLERIIHVKWVDSLMKGVEVNRGLRNAFVFKHKKALLTEKRTN